MKYFAWNEAKNERLKIDRDIGFEEIVFHIARGDLLDVLEHPNQKKYRNQRIFLVLRDEYVFLVPFVEDNAVVFFEDDHPKSKSGQTVSRKGDRGR